MKAVMILSQASPLPISCPLLCPITDPSICHNCTDMSRQFGIAFHHYFQWLTSRPLRVAAFHRFIPSKNMVLPRRFLFQEFSLFSLLTMHGATSPDCTRRYLSMFLAFFHQSFQKIMIVPQCFLLKFTPILLSLPFTSFVKVMVRQSNVFCWKNSTCFPAPSPVLSCLCCSNIVFGHDLLYVE